MFVISVWPESIFSLLSAGAGLKLYACSHLLMALNASVILGLAFMFSCFNMKPAAATILALSFLFINLVMEHIPFFEQYQEWFLPYHFRAWLLTYADPVPWDRVIGSLCILVAFNLTTFFVGAAAFQAREVRALGGDEDARVRLELPIARERHPVGVQPGGIGADWVRLGVRHGITGLT